MQSNSLKQLGCRYLPKSYLKITKCSGTNAIYTSLILNIQIVAKINCQTRDLVFMFYAYALQSEIDNGYHIRHLSDMKKRLEYHNQGLSEYTSKKIPVPSLTDKTKKTSVPPVNTGANFLIFKSVVDNF